MYVISLFAEPDLQRGVMHCFELRTANVDYFVGEEPVAVKDKAPILNPPETGVGMDLAKVSPRWIFLTIEITNGTYLTIPTLLWY